VIEQVSGGTATQAVSIRRIARILYEGAPLVYGALADVAMGLRIGGQSSSDRRKLFGG
jgi:hypothetical protein